MAHGRSHENRIHRNCIQQQRPEGGSTSASRQNLSAHIYLGLGLGPGPAWDLEEDFKEGCRLPRSSVHEW